MFTRIVQFRLTAEQYDEILTQARLRGIAISDLIRVRVLQLPDPQLAPNTPKSTNSPSKGKTPSKRSKRAPGPSSGLCDRCARINRPACTACRRQVAETQPDLNN